MPESARIMRRGSKEVNGAPRALDLRDVAPRWAIVAAALCVAALAISCGGGERKAERLLREAERSVEKGEPAKAVERLETILREHPDTEAAGRARERLVLYRGLAEAVERYPQRRAREIVVATARAIERHRAARRSMPDSLQALVPSWLDAVPSDPWGRALVYERASASSYRLTSLGADGARGGDGDDADIVVVNGKFVEDVAP